MTVTKQTLTDVLVASAAQDATLAAEMQALTAAVRASVAVGEDHTAIARDRIRLEKAKQKNRQATIKIVLSSQAASSGVVLVIYIIASLMGVDLGVLSL